MSVEKNRERKRKLVTTAALEKLNSTGSSSMSSSVDVSVPKRLPRIEIQETGPIFHISLVTSLEHKFMFHEIIRVLTEELGAGLTHAGYSIVDDAVFHIFDCKVYKSNKKFIDLEIKLCYYYSITMLKLGLIHTVFRQCE